MPFIRFAGQGKPKVKELNVPKESYISAVSAVYHIPKAISTTLPPKCLLGSSSVRSTATVLDQSFETQPKEPKTVRMSGPVDVLQT